MTRILFLLLTAVLPIVAADGVMPLTSEAAVHAPPPIFTVIPFVVLLLAIALMPVIRPHFWHRWYPAVAIGLGALTAGYYLIGRGEFYPLAHVGFEYVTFISLLACLYVCSGGSPIGVKEPPTLETMKIKKTT